MLKNYFKIAIAVLKRNKFFTFISLFGISCTLAVLMVITAFVDHLVSANYPEVNAARSMYIMNLHFQDTKFHNRMNTSPSFYYLNTYVKSLKTPEKISISDMGSTASAYLKNKKYDFRLKNTDADFWEIMQFNFLEGKPYNTAQIKNSERVAVIAEDTRKIYFGDASAVGKFIEADNIQYRVIGVVQNVPKTRIVSSADIYVPYTSPKSGYDSKILTGRYLAVLLAKDKSDFKKIDREYQHVLPSVPKYDEHFNVLYSHADTFIESFSRTAMGDNNSSGMSKIYMIAALLLFLFFLLPTVNLVNINISRIMERSSEIGVRKAFGASVGTLIIQFIVENIILTFIGGCIGLIFSFMIILYINSSGLIPNIDLKIDTKVLEYGLILCLVFGLFSGVYPAFKMSKLQIIKSLKSGS